MEHKKCNTCGFVKPLGDFPLHKNMMDGHINKCKVCRSAYAKQYREGNIEYCKAYDTERNKTEHRKISRKKRLKERMEDPEFRNNLKTKRDIWEAKVSLKRWANSQWSDALRCGKVTRARECEKCGAKDDLHGHHEDYTKPLDVITLCRTCHGLRHREINELIRNGEDWSGKGF